ncbi:MAG: hypothetical protein BWY11_02510 [Firmicutes bacterium ADurb.Bin182]|nr:MAG: hypothetical protein BWY11_02510 [Firmicutes bacterium ADurb.Bin182]
MIYVFFLTSLAGTLVVEGIIIALWFRRRDFIYYSALCNLLTNPAMNLLLLIIIWYTGMGYYPVVLFVLEIAVLAAEALVIKLLCGFRPAKALFVSFVVNAASLLTGLLINGLYTV